MEATKVEDQSDDKKVGPWAFHSYHVLRDA